MVKDPLSGGFFRLGAAEQFIAQQCDGATPIPAIREKTEREFGASLTDERLHQFIAHLDRAGLLERPLPSTESRQQVREGFSTSDFSRRAVDRRRQKRRFRGSLLALRIRLCDPDRLLSFLDRGLGWCFSKAFVRVAVLLLLAATCIAISNWPQVRAEAPQVYRLSVVPVIVLIVFGVAIGHELAHGLACKHFGGEVHELGLLLLYLVPAAYCNVTDAWLFPEKAKRLLVAFAGPFFELVLWAVATLCWRITDVDTGIHVLAFIIMTTSGIKTLFNFNPLLKLDGYYLLSDYLELPNLRKRAFRHIGNTLKQLLGRRISDVRPDSREQRILLAYGLIAGVFSLSFLGFAMSKLAGYVTDKNQPVAFALFAGLVAVKVHRRFRRFFGKSTVESDLDQDSDASSDAGMESNRLLEETKPFSHDEANESGENLEGDAPSTNRAREIRLVSSRWLAALRSRWPWPAKLLILVALASPSLFFVRTQLKVHGQFTVLPVQNADVRSEVEGIISEVFVHEGQEVHAGELIATLSDRDLRAELQKTDAEIAQSKANLKKLQDGPTPEDIQVAKAAVASAQDHLSFARKRLERDKSLFEQHLLARKDFEDTQDQATSTQNDLNAANSKLQQLLAGSRPEDIEAIKASIAWSESQRRLLQEQIRLLRIVSPIDGIVATPATQLEELTHQLVKKGDIVAKVYDYKTITAEICASEKDIADVHVGQKVILKARAVPNATFQGTVTLIATAAQLDAGPSAPANNTSAGTATLPPRIVRVTTVLQNPSLLLRPQMTGQAKILCGRTTLFGLLARWLAQTFKVPLWSWW